MRSLIVFLVCCLAVVVSQKNYYRAAVYEHTPHKYAGTYPAKQTLDANLKDYKKAIKVAGQQHADIVVFGEYGLFPNLQPRPELQRYYETVPEGGTGLVPCSNSSMKRTNPVLYALSCAAKKSRIYVVAVMGDHQPCKPNIQCPADNQLLYNAAVVLDKQGRLVTKYHKYHPYFETVNIPPKIPYIAFDTEFGRFGVDICYDIVFNQSVYLSHDYGVDTYVFPTHWFDEAAPLNAVEYQRGFAMANRITLICGATHTPGWASLGSGIYTKDGSVAYTYDPNRVSRLLIANVPIHPEDTVDNPDVQMVAIPDKGPSYQYKESGDSFPYQCYEEQIGQYDDLLSDYRCNTSLTDFMNRERINGTSGSQKLCYGNFCCEINYNRESDKEDYYLTVFNDLLSNRDYYYLWYQACMVIRCDPFLGEPCVTEPSRATTVFSHLDIQATFTSLTVMPTVTTDKFRLAPTSEWSYSNDTDGTYTLKYDSKDSKPLLKAALVGRDYPKDKPYVPFIVAYYGEDYM